MMPSVLCHAAAAPDDSGAPPVGQEKRVDAWEKSSEAERLRDSAEDAFMRKDYVKAVDEFTRASELAPNDAELTAALQQARTLLAGARSDSTISSVQDGMITDGMVVQTPPRLPQTPTNPDQELLRKEVEIVSSSVKKMQQDQERLASDVREALAQTMAQTESLRKALETQLEVLSDSNRQAKSSADDPRPAPALAGATPVDKESKSSSKQAASRATKNVEQDRSSAKKTEKKLKDQVKIVDVFDYTFNLCRDLVSPERLGRDKRNYVKRLLYIVWPKKLVGGTGLTEDGLPDGSKEILATFVLALARTVVMNMSSNLLRQLQNAVYRRDSMWIFIKFLPYSALLTVLGSFMSSAMTYASEKLVITWRDQLTRQCHSYYFSMSSYYHIKNLPGREKIADPDERLAAEVTEVTKKLTMVVGLLFRGIPPIIWFTFRLWRERGLVYATLPHIYLLLAYEITSRIFPKNIGELYRDQAMVQGKYFKTVSRVQTHSEAIYALNGGEREHAIVNKKFEGVEGAATALYKALSRFGLIFKVAYTYGCRSWIATAVMLPIISSGNTGSGTDRLAAEVGETRYGMDMMVEMLVANGTILTLHYVANQMAGQAGRIAKLIDTCEKLCEKRKAEKSGTFVDGDCIAFDDVDVHTPNGKLLVKGLNFSLKIGGSLLLTGHNGAGKSSIFRCLGGLWSVPKGTITKPGGNAESLSESVFYLPQKPYNCNGSLSDQITYPETNTEVTTEQLEDLLRRVDLSHLLLESSAAADVAVNWEDKLSLGEQQRLAMARLFYHRPKFAILDECAVSLEMEAALYKECKSMSITYITICHRPALKAYHVHNLNLTGDGEGGWEYTKIDQSKVHARVATASVEGEDKLREKHLAARSEPYRHMETMSSADLTERTNVQKLMMLLKIAVPGSEKKLGLLIAGIIGRTLCHEAYSRVVGGLYNAVITRNTAKFVLFALVNVVQDLFNGCVEEGVVLMQELVGIAWYQRLTQHCTERFFAGSNFYCVKNIDKRISDVDQRLTKEVVDLSKEFPKMFASAVTPVFDVLWFTGRMVSLLGVVGMIPFYLYIGATFAVSKFLMPNYEALFTKEQELESDYRFCQTRLRTHAESVAFFGGDEMEHKIATSFFEKLVDHMYIVRRKTAEFKFFFHCINKDFKSYSNNVSTPEIVTILMQIIYARRHALDAMADGTAGALASSTFYVRSAVIRTVESFGQIFDLYETMAKLLGSGTRVCQMIDVLEDMSSRVDPSSTGSDANKEQYEGSVGSATPTDVVFNDVDIVTPLGQCLAKDLSVTVASNTPLMVTGPNSVGKTSFFRALAGLWPVPKGAVSSPGAPSGVFLVPQRPYAVLGSLADQITYPASIPKAMRDEARLRACLEHVGIFYLVAQFEKEGGWDAEKTWEDVFSGGEMQRMGLARVFYHQPAFAVLDECTDAVSVDVEEGLYRSLRDEGVTTITISKRLALTEFHDAELQLYDTLTCCAHDYYLSALWRAERPRLGVHRASFEQDLRTAQLSLFNPITAHRADLTKTQLWWSHDPKPAPGLVADE